jgi:hypothetical protein
MPYVITQYTRRRARTLGVTVKLSTRKTKKIDVFKNGVKVASVGGAGYSDYPTYMRERGAEYAKERRRLYRIRHAKDRDVPGTAGFYADKLLW